MARELSGAVRCGAYGAFRSLFRGLSRVSSSCLYRNLLGASEAITVSNGRTTFGRTNLLQTSGDPGQRAESFSGEIRIEADKGLGTG